LFFYLFPKEDGRKLFPEIYSDKNTEIAEKADPTTTHSASSLETTSRNVDAPVQDNDKSEPVKPIMAISQGNHVPCGKCGRQFKSNCGVVQYLRYCTAVNDKKTTEIPPTSRVIEKTLLKPLSSLRSFIGEISKAVQRHLK